MGGIWGLTGDQSCRTILYLECIPSGLLLPEKVTLSEENDLSIRLDLLLHQEAFQTGTL